MTTELVLEDRDRITRHGRAELFRRAVSLRSECADVERLEGPTADGRTHEHEREEIVDD